MGCLWHSTHLTASPQMELVEQSKIAQKHIPPFQILKSICSLRLDQSTLQEQLLVLGFDSHRSWVRLFLHLFIERLLARIVLISKLRKRKIMIVSWKFSFHYTTGKRNLNKTHSLHLTALDGLDCESAPCYTMYLSLHPCVAVCWNHMFVLCCQQAQALLAPPSPPDQIWRISLWAQVSCCYLVPTTSSLVYSWVASHFAVSSILCSATLCTG